MSRVCIGFIRLWAHSGESLPVANKAKVGDMTGMKLQFDMIFAISMYGCMFVSVCQCFSACMFGT